jgi:nicotinate phosphoribosyltransferase
MKLSQDISKVLIPGRKKAYRLFGKDGSPLLDVMLREDEDEPEVGKRLLCRHPFIERKMVAVTPSAVEPLHRLVFENGTAVDGSNHTLMEAKQYVADQLSCLPPNILRPENPKPYKVSISRNLFSYFRTLWQDEAPVTELC